MCALRKGGWTHTQTNRGSILHNHWAVIDSMFHTLNAAYYNQPLLIQTGRGGNLALALSQTGRNVPKWEKGACQPNAIMAFNERHRNAQSRGNWEIRPNCSSGRVDSPLTGFRGRDNPRLSSQIKPHKRDWLSPMHCFQLFRHERKCIKTIDPLKQIPQVLFGLEMSGELRIQRYKVWDHRLHWQHCSYKYPKSL